MKKIDVFKIVVNDLNSSKSINLILENAKNQIIRECKIKPDVFDDERYRLTLRNLISQFRSRLSKHERNRSRFEKRESGWLQTRVFASEFRPNSTRAGIYTNIKKNAF